MKKNDKKFVLKSSNTSNLTNLQRKLETKSVKNYITRIISI